MATFIMLIEVMSPGPIHARASSLYMMIKIAKNEGILARFPNKNLGRVFTYSRVMKRTFALNLSYYVPFIRSWPIPILKYDIEAIQILHGVIKIGPP